MLSDLPIKRPVGRPPRFSAQMETSDPPDDGLIAVAKGGEVLRVHPATLKAHVSVGWKLHSGSDE